MFIQLRSLLEFYCSSRFSSTCLHAPSIYVHAVGIRYPILIIIALVRHVVVIPRSHAYYVIFCSRLITWLSKIRHHGLSMIVPCFCDILLFCFDRSLRSFLFNYNLCIPVSLVIFIKLVRGNENLPLSKFCPVGTAVFSSFILSSIILSANCCINIVVCVVSSYISPFLVKMWLTHRAKRPFMQVEHSSIYM